MRSVARLLKGVRKVYGEEFGIPETVPLAEENSKQETRKAREKLEEPVILKYVKHQIQGGFHPLFSTLMKGAAVITEDQFVAIMPIAWELLLEPDPQVYILKIYRPTAPTIKNRA